MIEIDTNLFLREVDAEMAQLEASTRKFKGHVALKIREGARQRSRVQHGTMRESWVVALKEPKRPRTKKRGRRLAGGGTSVGLESVETASQTDRQAQAMVEKAPVGSEVWVGSLDWKTHFHENGTTKNAPQPMLRPAVEAVLTMELPEGAA